MKSFGISPLSLLLLLYSTLYLLTSMSRKHCEKLIYSVSWVHMSAPLTRCQNVPVSCHFYKAEERRWYLGMNIFKYGSLKWVEHVLDNLIKKKIGKGVADLFLPLTFSKDSIITSSSEKYWTIRKCKWPVTFFLSKGVVTMLTHIFHLLQSQYEWLTLALNPIYGVLQLRQLILLYIYTIYPHDRFLKFTLYIYLKEVRYQLLIIRGFLITPMTQLNCT